MKRNTLNTNSDFLKNLIRKGIPHTVKYSGASTYVTVGERHWVFTDKGLKMAELGFLSQVKAHVKKLPQSDFPEFPAHIKQPAYFRYTKALKPGFFHIAAETDINAAYWNTAYQLGYIDEKIHKKGMLLDKHARLIAWGAIAAQKKVFNFDGAKYKQVPTEQNKRIRSFFFHVAHEVGAAMETACKATGTLFFWVDALFSEGDGHEQAEALEAAGFAIKQKQIEYIEVKPVNKFLTHINVMEAGAQRPKLFQKAEGNRLEYQRALWEKARQAAAAEMQPGTNWHVT